MNSVRGAKEIKTFEELRKLIEKAGYEPTIIKKYGIHEFFYVRYDGEEVGFEFDEVGGVIYINFSFVEIAMTRPEYIEYGSGFQIYDWGHKTLFISKKDLEEYNEE